MRIFYRHIYIQTIGIDDNEIVVSLCLVTFAIATIKLLNLNSK